MTFGLIDPDVSFACADAYIYIELNIKLKSAKKVIAIMWRLIMVNCSIILEVIRFINGISPTSNIISN